MLCVQHNIYGVNMIELCMVVAISIGYLNNEKIRVYDIDCKSNIYKVIEIENKIIEVEQLGNNLYIKDKNGN